MALDISSINHSPQQAFHEVRGQAGSAQVAEAQAAQAAEARAVAAQAASERLKAEMASADPSLQAPNLRLAFSVNSKLDEVVVKVIDSDTDKVVREIPAEELQHVYERIREVVGLLFDQSA